MRFLTRQTQIDLNKPGRDPVTAYRPAVTKRVAACPGKWSERADAKGVPPGGYVGERIGGKSEFRWLSGPFVGEGWEWRLGNPASLLPEQLMINPEDSPARAHCGWPGRGGYRSHRKGGSAPNRQPSGNLPRLDVNSRS